MFNKIRSVFARNLETSECHNYESEKETSTRILSYGRPDFLKLDQEQVQTSIDHRLRPIISATEELPLLAGYAECINAGKSWYNEDQATAIRNKLEPTPNAAIPYEYFALFDGHAGVGAALRASRQLHHILHVRLCFISYKTCCRNVIM